MLTAHALVGWAYCGALMAIGPAVTSMENALIIHAIGAPIGFAVISFVYFTRFGSTSPLYTAAWFTSVIIAMDALLVAPFIEKSYAMFASIPGTWLPFALIFAATYATGRLTAKST